MSKKVGYVWNTLYSWVDTGTGGLLSANLSARIQPSYQHLAHPDTKRRFNELVHTSGQIDHLTPVQAKAATDEDILRVHTAEMLAQVKHLSGLPTGGLAGDGVTNIGNGGIEIAYLSAGGAIELTKKVVTGELSTGYALINPPGHHATRNETMGFCYFNNTSVAAAYAKDVLGVKRVAIVDWDVHHGNGTQDIWYADASVLTISIHQDRCFPPNSGFIDERGESAGFGYNLNIPLPPGSGNAAYQYAFETVVIPALKQYQPELIIIGSGFDANILDPLARTMVTAKGFKALAQLVLDCADEVCDGKIVFVQEGGYSPHYVPFCGLAVIQTLTGVETVADAFEDIVGAMGGDKLLDHEKQIIDQVTPLIQDIL
ncbi:class II histone deacetylase [Acinetobacter sp. ANC 4558]|uniref:class II histone deacetylase n=1 Tax=Acinetobacter sp. ANC 4558 TaxID=1977876 RepID=UPI000A354BB9|nr:class II histone deacetylase [Acinetobacter sp. ANC 4558]OTG81882.1 class II histone deacetylase [Acinetobacter sp. ANC 4558]